jgi:hypothetical protein
MTATDLVRTVVTAMKRPERSTPVAISRRFTRIALAAGAGLLLLAACGGSSSNDQNADSGSETDGTTAPGPDTTGPPQTDGGTDNGSFGVPDLVDASYASGTAHVEMSGDNDASADFTTGGGFTGQGTTFISFSDGTGAQQLTISIGSTAAESGISATFDGVSTGGAFGDACSIEVTTNTASEVAGHFSCDGIDAINQSTVLSVNLDGTFSVSA